MTTKFGLFNGNAEAAFKSSFAGVVENKQFYSNPYMGIDKRKEIGAELQKTLTIDGNVYAAGNLPVLIPVYVDPTITDLTRKQTPLVELLPRQAVRGYTIDFNRITAKGGAEFLADGATGLTGADDTYERASVPIKFAYSIGDVTGPTIKASEGFLDIMSQDIMVKTLALRELEEDTILNGDATANPLEFDGLRTLITTNVQDLTATNVDLATIRQSIADAFGNGGNVNLAITDAYTHNYIKGLLMEYQRYVDKAEDLPFGISGSFSIDGVAFIKSRFMPTASGSREIVFIDTSVVYMGVLLDATYEELAKTKDSQNYMIKEYLALVLRAEQFCSKIINIA